MSEPQQGSRIVWLVRSLTLLGLVMVAVTVGLIGWTLIRVRGERALAAGEQDRLNQASHELRQCAVESRAETLLLLDETTSRSRFRGAAANFAALIRAQLHSDPEPDRAVRPALMHLESQAMRLNQLVIRAEAWRAEYDPVWSDVSKQLTMGKARALFTQLRSGVEALEGRRRLDDAIQYRRWRKAEGETANALARDLLIQQARQQSAGVSDFKGELAECARLVELLGGEEQLDNLADLRDNKLKPILARLGRAITAFGAHDVESVALTPRAIDDLQALLLGEGSISWGAPIRVGGIFALRRDALLLRRDRERLKGEITSLFQDIEAANATFALTTQTRAGALTQQMERSLALAWARMLVVGGGCSALFLWLAWLISRGIHAQVRALDDARNEAEEGRRTTQVLMLEQQAASTKLANAHRELQTSELRFRTLSNSAPIGIFLTDVQGRVVYNNPPWLSITGLSLEQSLGDGWVRALHPEDAATVRSEWDRAAAEGREFDREFRFQTPDGRDRWVHARSAAIRSGAGEITGHVGTVEDVTDRKQSEAELEMVHRDLIETSRLAGMAEVATGVLHNVGNVLNSVNVSATLVAEKVKNSKSASLGKVVALLRQHETDFGAFFEKDPKGKQIPVFLATLSEHLASERTALIEELTQLQRNIDHIKGVVAMQQSYAKVSGVTETLHAASLVEDSLRMNSEILSRQDIVVTREFEEVLPITVEKHRVLQILVNIIRNAMQACEETKTPEKRIRLRVCSGEGRVKISVTDNGIGIFQENLTRIFSHGFTTKKQGHGFGLHGGALAAKEMGGALLVHSDGPGTGATFTLELPAGPSRPVVPGSLGTSVNLQP